jgi:hypothetical protein
MYLTVLLSEQFWASARDKRNIKECWKMCLHVRVTLCGSWQGSPKYLYFA